GLIDYVRCHARCDGQGLDNGNAEIGAIYVRDTSERNYKSDTKLQFLRVVRDKLCGGKDPCTKIKQIGKGDNLVPGGRELATNLTCYWSQTGVLQDENRGSIALLARFGAFNYYTAGDLPSDIEDDLNLPSLHPFKCGHHGSTGS